MKKKFICTVCGYIYEGTEAPEKCPICKACKSNRWTHIQPALHKRVQLLIPNHAFFICMTRMISTRQ